MKVTVYGIKNCDTIKKARAWLVRATRADPDPAWCCASCGNVAAAWAATFGPSLRPTR